MANWYWRDNAERRGPISSKELIALAAAGRISAQTLVYRDGDTEWVAASVVKGLFDRPRPSNGPPPFPEERVEPSIDSNIFGMARERASSLLGELRSVNFREEIIPVDATNLKSLSRDYVFWSVVLLGTVPLLIGTINNESFQLTAYLFFFAAMWGVVFRDFIVRAPVKWRWLIASAAFTGLIGMRGLLFIHAILPNAYMDLRRSSNVLVNLTGSVLVTGLTEEFCKAIPVLAYLLWKRKRAEPSTAILLGVFSGLGFAAIENVGYANQSLGDPLLLGVHYGSVDAYVAGVQSVISHALLRSMSDVFGHAVLSGIVAYFLVMAFLTARRAPVLAVVGLGLAALLHGSFNWLAGLQLTFATFVNAGAFLLFYGYMLKLRNLIAEDTVTVKTTGTGQNDSQVISSASSSTVHA